MPIYLIVIAISVSIIVLLTIILLIIRKKVYANIVAFTWERSITFEQRGWTKESSYNGFPKNSRNGKTIQENYRRSTTVYREKQIYRPGNLGTSDYEWVSEPVTEWKWETRAKYEYEVPQWKSGQTVLASGRSRKDVHWPNYTHGDNAREGKRKEKYIVCFIAENGKRYDKSVAENVWVELDANARYLLKTTFSGKVSKIQLFQKEAMQAYQPRM